MCALCGTLVKVDKSVLDHCHKHGALRGVLHRGCNSMLGVLENNRNRFELADDDAFEAFLAGVAAYLKKHKTPQTVVLHPTFLTEDEKRIKRNTTARKKRAATKTKEA